MSTVVFKPNECEKPIQCRARCQDGVFSPSPEFCMEMCVEGCTCPNNELPNFTGENFLGCTTQCENWTPIICPEGSKPDICLQPTACRDRCENGVFTNGGEMCITQCVEGCNCPVGKIPNFQDGEFISCVSECERPLDPSENCPVNSSWNSCASSCEFPATCTQNGVAVGAMDPNCEESCQERCICDPGFAVVTNTPGSFACIAIEDCAPQECGPKKLYKNFKITT